MNLESAAKLCAAAYSGSQGARKRLGEVLGKGWSVAPNKGEAAKYARELSGAKLKDAEAAVAQAIEAFRKRETAEVGDVLGRPMSTTLAGSWAVKLHPNLPWASAERVAARLQASQELAMGDNLYALSDDYSGTTHRRVRIAGSTDAGTETSRGETYSRGCTYRKTDAVHWIEQTPQAVLRLYHAVRQGLPVVMAGMVHLDAVPVSEGRYSVVAAKNAKGKTLGIEKGLVQRMAEGDWFHAHDERAILREVRRRATARTAPGLIRASLNRPQITVAAVRRLGWCEPGIFAWLRKWARADGFIEARRAPRRDILAAAERAAAAGDHYGSKLLGLMT